MSMLSVMEAKLPPGFRFHPRDEELVCDYLAKKVSASGTIGAYSSFSETPMMLEVDLNKIEPWDLPDLAKVGGKEWYFYSLRDRKYATGLRTNRATMSGYWKATGKDRKVIDRRSGGTAVAGMRKTLVFYQGRAPKGKKTEWVMHEFRLEGTFDPPKKTLKQEDWVLCRVFHKNKILPTKLQVHESSIFDDTGSSSSLPSLSDNFLTFDQTPLSLEELEQVPCFSKLPQTNTNNLISPILDHNIDLSDIPTTEIIAAKEFQDLGEFLNPISYENNVIRAALDHLTKLDSSRMSTEVAPRFGLVGTSLEMSYIPEMGLSPIWSTGQY